MGSLLKWSEWVSLRETNARQRAVKAALAGNGPSLPGSYAACPSTNPRAMRQAAKTGVVNSDPKKLVVHETEAKPDYSFDRWIKKATEFGDDVNKLVGHAKDDEQDLDSKEKEQAKKPTPKPEPEQDEPPQEDDKETVAKKETAWKQLKQIHDDRMKQADSKDPKKQTDEES